MILRVYKATNELFFFFETKTSTSVSYSNCNASTKPLQKLFIFVFLDDLLSGNDYDIASIIYIR